MDNTEAKLSFFKKINLKTDVSMAEYIKKNKLWKERSLDGIYTKLTSINARENAQVVQPKDILSIYKRVYDFWYNRFSKAIDRFQPQDKQRLSEFFSNPKYQKENMSPQDCYDFMHGGFNKTLKGIKNGGYEICPLNSQSGDEPIIDNAINPDFIHIFSFMNNNDTKCRLYLNISSQNMASLCQKFLDKCEENRQFPYFKFHTIDYRSDTFLIYTSFEKAPTMIKILDEIKAENAQLFEGTQNLNPLLSRINGYIGFGDEPEYKHSSFNLERSRAIGEFNDAVIKSKLIEERLRIGNDQGTITTSDGQELKIDEYLKYRLRNSFLDTLKKNQKRILDRDFPKEYTTNSQIKNWIEIETKIFNACKNGLPEFVEEQIDKIAKDNLQDLKAGKKPVLSPIKFQTKRKELFPTLNDDYLDQIIKRDGSLPYSERIDLNLEEKLFQVYGSEGRIEASITDEALKPYFDKHHVSIAFPPINTESENLIQKNQEAEEQ